MLAHVGLELADMQPIEQVGVVEQNVLRVVQVNLGVVGPAKEIERLLNVGVLERKIHRNVPEALKKPVDGPVADDVDPRAAYDDGTRIAHETFVKLLGCDGGEIDRLDRTDLALDPRAFQMGVDLVADGRGRRAKHVVSPQNRAQQEYRLELERGRSR